MQYKNIKEHGYNVCLTQLKQKRSKFLNVISLVQGKMVIVQRPSWADMGKTSTTKREHGSLPPSP